MTMNNYRDICFSVHDEECINCGHIENVDVHHIDGDAGNNSILNLIPLCKGCHSDVHAGNLEPWSAFLEQQPDVVDYKTDSTFNTGSVLQLYSHLSYSKYRVDGSGRIHIGTEYSGKVFGVALVPMTPST